MKSMEINKQPERSFPIQQKRDKIAENCRGQGNVGGGNLTSQLTTTAEELLLNWKLIGKRLFHQVVWLSPDLKSLNQFKPLAAKTFTNIKMH